MSDAIFSPIRPDMWDWPPLEFLSETAERLSNRPEKLEGLHQGAVDFLTRLKEHRDSADVMRVEPSGNIQIVQPIDSSPVRVWPFCVNIPETPSGAVRPAWVWDMPARDLVSWHPSVWLDLPGWFTGELAGGGLAMPTMPATTWVFVIAECPASTAVHDLLDRPARDLTHGRMPSLDSLLHLITRERHLFQRHRGIAPPPRLFVQRMRIGLSQRLAS